MTDHNPPSISTPKKTANPYINRLVNPYINLLVSLLLVAMICGTLLGIVWMVTT